MATLLKRLSFVARVATQRAPCIRPARRFALSPQARFLTTTVTTRSQNGPNDDESIEGFPADSEELVDDEDEEEDEEEQITSLEDIFNSPVTSGELTGAERTGDIDEEETSLHDIFDADEGDELDDELGRITFDGESMEPFQEDDEDVSIEGAGEPKWPPGFFSTDEERDDPGEDPEFENDDITSTAHGELEQHRELREFARVMVWDMPLLFNQARAFEAPTAAQPLRFRYTTYMGETHPASRKVVMTFSPSALPDLTEIQTSKLIKLLGVRYNPSTTSAKLSCELYPTAAQNKRYLCDLLDKLTTEAKDPTDTFEDVPFDFRHHKVKKVHVFPEEWKLTDERRKALEARREEKRRLEDQKTLQGKLVQGTLLIEEMLRSSATSEKEAVLQMATGIEQKGKQQKRRSIR